MKNEGIPQNNENIEKHEQWERVLKNLENIVDGLGMPIEEGIKEAVASLNINKIPTGSSCGGHVGPDRLSFPYISGEAEGEPRYRYQGEDKIIDDLMVKYNLTNRREIFDNGEIENEYYKLTDKLEETDEYKKWYLKNQPLRQQVGELIEEFNITRPESKMHLTPIYPGYKFEAHDRQKKFNDEVDNKKEIEQAQEEFRLFTEFLKNKFFTE